MSTEEWFNLLPQDIRDKAIQNTPDYMLEYSGFNTFRECMYGAFSWSGSNEGFDFWFNFFKSTDNVTSKD